VPGDEDDCIRFMGFEVERIGRYSREDDCVGYRRDFVDCGLRPRVEILKLSGRKQSLGNGWTCPFQKGRVESLLQNVQPSGTTFGLSAQRDFRIVSNSYLGAPGNDDIHLVDYDPLWPGKYEKRRRR